MFELQAVGDKAIVRRQKRADRTPGGLVIPESVNQTDSETGYVVSAGPDAAVNDGNTVYFSKYAGVELKTGEETFVVLRPDDILAIQIYTGTAS